MPLDDDPETAASGSSRIRRSVGDAAGRTCELGNLAALFGNPKEKRNTFAASATDREPGSKRPKRSISLRMTRYYRHAKPADSRVSFVADEGTALPFANSAELLRTHESTFTWSGDLAVTFPGLDPLSLAGPRFSVAMCASTGCVLSQEEASSASARLSQVAARSTPIPSR